AGWLKRMRPPSRRSSVSSSVTRLRLLGLGQHLPGALQEVVRNHEAAWKGPDVAFHAADVGVEQNAFDARAREHRLGPGQMDEVVAAQEFPHDGGILY